MIKRTWYKQQNSPMKHAPCFLAKIVLSLLFVSHCFQAEAQQRNSAWTIGLSSSRHDLTHGDLKIYHGSASSIKIGKSYMGKHWLAGFSLDILAGPHNSPGNQSVDIDFTGTGMSSLFGYQVIGDRLRAGQTSYGFILSFLYSDMVGRSVGHQIESSNNPNPINNWVMRVNNFSAGPSLFLSWLKPPREVGDSPELLKTRLEGVIIQCGFYAPTLARYKLKFTDKTGQQNVRGDLYGKTYFLSMTVLFGA